MPIKYFYKELANNVIFDRNGKVIPWEPLSNWDGVCQIDDAKNPQLAEDLTNMIGTGGVTSITEGEYGSKKETHPFRGYQEKSSGVRAFSPPQLGRPKAPAEAAAAAASEPVVPALPAAPEPPAEVQTQPSPIPKVGRPTPRAPKPPDV